MTSSYDRILRSAALSPRNYRVGEAFEGRTDPVDRRPFTVQEAEQQHAREMSQLREQHAAAIEDAYRRGHEEGAEAANRNAGAQLQRLTSWLESLTGEFGRTRALWFDACEQQIVELIGCALEQILGDRPPVSDRFAHALRLAFEQLSGGDRVIVRCHPDDLEFAKQLLSSGLSGKGNFKHLRVTADPGVGVNGCLVETDLGVVDARVEKQLAILKNALAECKPNSSD